MGGDGVKRVRVMREKSFELPEPEEYKDYYNDELRRYTVLITVEVNALRGDGNSHNEIAVKAVEGFRSGKLDGETEIVHSEKIKDVQVNEDGSPFDLETWQKAKCRELGFSIDGRKLRPGEMQRPANEKTLAALI